MAAQSPESWRVVLFTDTPDVVPFYREYLPARGHRLVGIVTSPKRRAVYIDVVREAPPECDVIVSNHPRRWAAMLQPLRPDLLIATNFPWRLPPELLALPRLGAINAHPALLPQYRGTDILNWILRTGASESGWSIQRMAPAFDTGPLLARLPFPVGDDDDPDALIGKLIETFPVALDAAFARVARGDVGDPQDESQARYYPRIEEEAAWKSIDWTQPARMVHNAVRSSRYPGALPPGAVGIIDGVPRWITRTRLVAQATGAAAPGTVVGREREVLFVQCGDGPLAILAHESV